MYHLNVGFLLVANEDGLVSLDLNGGSQTVLVRGERHTVAVDYDIGYIITQCFSRTEYERLFVCVLLFRSNSIYWTDVVLGRIRRSFLNGSNVTTILSRRIQAPGQLLTLTSLPLTFRPDTEK